MKSRIMYIENKGTDGISGHARIGRVNFKKSSKSLYYAGQRFYSLNGNGFKLNYMNAETHEEYWISGCKKRGGDRLYSGMIEIDDDVREEYWAEIRNKPECKHLKVIHDSGKY